MQIIWRIQIGGSGKNGCLDRRVVDGAAIQRCFGSGQAMRLAARADDADMRVYRAAGGVDVIPGGDAGEREVAAPQGKFLERPTTRGIPRRQAYFHDELVVRKRGRKRPSEKVRSARRAT